MWMLIRKDLILDRRVTTINFAFYLVLLPAYASLGEWVPPAVYAGFAAVVCSIFPLTLVGREEKFHTAALTCSLPVTRDAIVASRYVGGWLVSLATTAVIVATGYLVPSTGFAGRGADVASALLTVFVIVGLVMAGLLPFTLRFGIVGLIGFLVGLQVLGIVAFLATVFTGGRGTTGRAIGMVVQAVKGLPDVVSPVALAALLVAAVGILNVLSFLLSRRIYRAREL